MRVAIVGAGAMGQLFGARLGLAGEDVTLLDTHAPTRDALRAGGITLHTEEGERHTRVAVGRATEFTQPFDLIVIFTKGFHTRAAVESVGHLIGPESLGLTLQNGLGHAEIVAQSFGASRTLAGVTDFPADLRSVGVVHSSTVGSVRLGAWRVGAVRGDAEAAVAADHAEGAGGAGGAEAAPAARVAAVADLLSHAGLRARVEADIRTAQWEKVAFNAAMNTLSAATGKTVGELGDSAEARDLAQRVLAETHLVAASHGIELDSGRLHSAVENAYAHHASHKTSMLLDLEAGRPLELEFIAGAVIAAGLRTGVTAAVLATLCQVVRMRAATAASEEKASPA